MHSAAGRIVIFRDKYCTINWTKQPFIYSVLMFLNMDAFLQKLRAIEVVKLETRFEYPLTYGSITRNERGERERKLKKGTYLRTSVDRLAPAMSPACVYLHFLPSLTLTKSRKKAKKMSMPP